MGNFINELMDSFGPEISKQLSTTLGVDEGQAGKMVPQVAPLILGGLKRQMENHGGASRVDHILNKYGSADVLGNLDDLFKQKSKDQNPDPRLGGLLGDSGVQATDLIANKFKIDGGTAAKLIPMLAPIILGFLTNKRDNQGAGSSGIASILDADGDGSVLDDVAGMLLGGGKSNPLGDVLGGLFGGKN